MQFATNSRPRRLGCRLEGKLAQCLAKYLFLGGETFLEFLVYLRKLNLFFRLSDSDLSMAWLSDTFEVMGTTFAQVN